MITEISSEAMEFGQQALRAFEAAGGDELVQRAEADPDGREALCTGVLTELGAWDLEPRLDADSLEAAAALCRSAGYWALPYPWPKDSPVQATRMGSSSCPQSGRPPRSAGSAASGPPSR